MRVRVPVLGDCSGLAAIEGFAPQLGSPHVCSINYEEHTPGHAPGMGSPTLTGGAPAMASHASKLRSRLGNQTIGRVARGQEHSGPQVIQPRIPTLQPSAAHAAGKLPPPPKAKSIPPQTQPGTLAAPTGTPWVTPLPPAFDDSPSVQLGEVLLPERAHDKRYYPGLVNDLDEEPSAKRGWQPWMTYAAAGLALFIAGLITRSVAFGPETHRVLVDITPSDATAQLDGQPLAGDNPRTREGLIAGDHVLLVERSGYVTNRQVFTLGEKGGDRRVVVTLDETPKPEPIPEPQAAVPEVQPVAPPVVDESLLSKRELAKLRRAERAAARAARREAAAASGDDSEPKVSKKEHSSKSDSGASGILKLNSTPWSEVYIDKKHVGHTPVLGLPLPAGSHTIELKNPALNLAKKLKIKLKAGETLVKIEKLGG